MNTFLHGVFTRVPEKLLDAYYLVHGISLSTFTSDHYVNDITTSVEIAHFVIQVRKTDSQS